MPQNINVRRPIRNSLVFISFVVLSILIGIFYFAQTIGLETDLPNPDETPADIQVGLRIEEINGLSDAHSAIIDLWEKDYTYRFNTPLVLVSIDYIYVSPNYIFNNKVCFQELSIMNREIEDSNYQNLFNKEDCAKLGINYFVDQSTDFAVLLYDKYETDYKDPYFYPFDTRSIDFSLLTKARILNETDEEITMNNSPRVDVVVTTIKSSRYVWKLESGGINNDASNLKLTLIHPLLYQLFGLLILFAMWIAIVSLPFTAEAENFWEVTIGIFGLWGIQGILLPDNIQGHTLIGDLILYLYLLLSGTIIFIFIRSMIRRWRQDYN